MDERPNTISQVDRTAFLARLADALQIDPDELSPETPLTPDTWDSLALLGTIALIDELFGVAVPTNDLKTCASVGEVLRLVDRDGAQPSA